MGSLAVLALIVFGFLVMFRVIPTYRIGKCLIILLAVIIFAPVALGVIQGQSAAFFSQPQPWWQYLLVFFGALLASRLLLNFIRPRRRR